MGSMAEDSSGAVAAPQVEVAEPEQLEAWADKGQVLLDQYKLKEAEQLFHKVLTHTDQSTRDRDKNVIISLVGLSEIYSKRARTMRGNELEWHRMQMHSITSKRKALKYCKNGIVAFEQDDEESRWFEKHEKKLKANLKVLQDCLVRSLQDRIIENKSGQSQMEKLLGIKRPRIVTDEQEQAEKNKPLVNTNWLENFQKYVKEKFEKMEETEDEPEDKYEEVKLKRSQSIETLQEIKPVRKKKINFEKVQAAIQDLVKQITTDMRHKQIHKDMTPEEKLILMSPMADNFDLLGTFKKALFEPDITEESEEDLENDETKESSQIDKEDKEKETEESIEDLSLKKLEEEEHNMDKSEVLLAAANWRQSQDKLNYDILSGSSKHWSSSSQLSNSLNTSSSNLMSQDGKEHLSGSRHNMTTLVEEMPSHHRNFVPSRRPTRVRRSHDPPGFVPEEEDALRNIGVLRVWQGYKQDNSQKENHHSQYKLQTYEELSPLTEVAGRSWRPLNQSKNKKKTEEGKEEDLSVSPGAAASESELNLTLAFALTTMADRLKKIDSLKEANALYMYALGIFKKSTDEIGEEDNHIKSQIAHIMQSLGTIKCSQGDFMGGSQLMEECISIYGLIKDQTANMSIAHTWFQLGSAFMAEQWKESTLYDYIMKAVKQVMEKEGEVRVEDENNEIDVDEDSEDEEEAEDNYWVSTLEAIGCFNRALETLRLIKEKNDEHNQLYVEVLTKLGDCNIMIGNYEQAIKYYEEALYMFKNIVGSATLPNNAHVLSMLGTTNFLCGNFSKAASMYECAQMLQQHIYGADDATFEMAFTLTMMGLTFYSMKRFHRSIAWCLKAFEIYTNLYKEEITNVGTLHRWFVTESLYVVGFSYGTLSFHDKALHYLGIAKCMVKGCENVDVKQCVKILKALADEYSTLDDNEKALAFYDEALQLSKALGNESSGSALQNQLLNRMAGLHVNTKEYSTAALYLQQALDYQKNVENTIKDDLIGILRQLGLTYTLSGDVDKAIECYNDCLDACQEVSSVRKAEKAQLMGTLGTLYHVKACIQDDNEDMENLLTRAEKFYQDAMSTDSTSNVCVQYANYLYQQAQAGDALLAMLPVVHSPSTEHHEDTNLMYNGVEQAVLPEHLQQEIDEMDEVALETRVFSKFLAILCYKQLKLDKDAEDCLVDLFKAVGSCDVALNHSILGYAMLEMNLYPEAAECFANAAALQHDNDLAITNYWISLCLWSYGTMSSSIRNIFADALREQEDEWVMEKKLRDAIRKANQKDKRVRDSGYYDHTVETNEDMTDEAWAPVEEITLESSQLTENMKKWSDLDDEDPVLLLRKLHERRRMREESEDITPLYAGISDNYADHGYTSNEFSMETDDGQSVTENVGKWESIKNIYDSPIESKAKEEQAGTYEVEETETPAVILEMLRQQQELLNREYKVHFDVGIIGEEDEEKQQVSKPKAETHSTFANMVETPQSILHNIERKMVEEEKVEQKKTLDSGHYRHQTNQVNQNNHQNVSSPSTPAKNDTQFVEIRHRHPEQNDDEWVTTVEEVVHHNIPQDDKIIYPRKREQEEEVVYPRKREPEDERSRYTRRQEQQEERAVFQSKNEQQHEGTVHPRKYEQEERTVYPRKYEQEERTVYPRKYEQEERTVYPRKYEQEERTVQPRKYEQEERTIYPRKYEQEERTVYPRKYEQEERTVYPRKQEQQEERVVYSRTYEQQGSDTRKHKQEEKVMYPRNSRRDDDNDHSQTNEQPQERVIYSRVYGKRDNREEKVLSPKMYESDDRARYPTQQVQQEERETSNTRRNEQGERILYPRVRDAHENYLYPKQEEQQHQQEEKIIYPRKREHSPEPNDSQTFEESWITQEVKVQPSSPPTHRHKNTTSGITQAENNIANRNTGLSSSFSSSSQRQITPMELSPDKEETSGESWSMEETIETPAAILQSMRHDKHHHYDVIDSIHNWDSEGNHVTQEQSGSNTKLQQQQQPYQHQQHQTYPPTQQHQQHTTEHNRPGNNNYQSRYHVNGSRQSETSQFQREETTPTTTAPQTQSTTSTTSSITFTPLRPSWRSHEIDTRFSYYTRPTEDKSQEETSNIATQDRWGRKEPSHTHDRWSDGQNGNRWSSNRNMYGSPSSRTTSQIQQSYTAPQQEQDDQYEEVWHSSEETIETPPEILAMLQAERS